MSKQIYNTKAKIEILRGEENYIKWYDEFIGYLRGKEISWLVEVDLDQIQSNSSGIQTRSQSKDKDAPDHASTSKTSDSMEITIKKLRIMKHLMDSVRPNIWKTVKNIKEPREALRKIEELYKPSGRDLCLQALGKLRKIQYEQGTPLIDHFDKIDDCFEVIESIRGTQDDEDKINVLWDSLGHHFHHVYLQAQHDAYKSPTPQSYEDIKTMLLRHESANQRRGIAGPQGHMALLTQKTRTNFGRNSRRGDNGNDNSQSA